MDGKEGFNVLKNFAYLSQFGLSLILPILILVLGSVYLRERFALGSWVTLVAIVLGLISCISTVTSFAGYMLKEAKKSEDDRKI